MATIAQSSGKRASAKPPISTHPAFPAIVALWFAALLGFGSLVLPVALLERLVTVTGIASLVPSAAPPLGLTAHVSIALAGALAGAALGLMLARQVARAHAPEPKARHYDLDQSRPRRPISADELGEEGLGSAAPGQPLLAQKRRSLAMTEENRKSTYLQAIPHPGQGEEEHDDFAAPEPDASAEAARVAEPLELGDFAAASGDDPLELEIEPDAALEMLRGQIHTEAASASFEDPMMTERPSLDQPFELPRAGSARQEFGSAGAPAIPQAYEPGRDAVDPLPFAAPSLRRAEPLAFDEDEGDEFEDQPADQDEGYAFEDRITEEEQETPMHLSVIESTDEPEEAAYDCPLDELGLVQLAARLGASLEKRKARLAAPQAPFDAPAAAALAEVEDFEMAEADDAARAIADFFGPASAAQTESGEPAAIEPEPEPELEAETQFVPAPAIPASMRVLSLDHDEADDEDALEASFSLPLTKAVAPVTAVDEDEETSDEDDSDYSSLLAMKNPFARQQEFVRVEEPEDESGAFEPAVTFPSAAPAPASVVDEDEVQPTPRLFDPPKNPADSAALSGASPVRRDPGDAERSLRDALATLQRMGGAA